VTVAEETIPAEADSGIRRFSVTFGQGLRIVIQIMQERQPDVPEGEIHPSACLNPCNDVCDNEMVTMACIQVAARTVPHPHLSYLPSCREEVRQ
jgi:hypothetical protein